jgi:PKHD-type hydroxylase
MGSNMRSIIKCPYYYFESAITDEFCDLIIAQGRENIQQDAAINTDGKQDKSYRRGKVAWIEEDWISKMLNAYVETANKEANWNFILTDKERVQFATYKKQDFYDYHRDCDIVQPLYRKLSVTVQLSDPETYKGGDLFIRHFWGKANLPIDEQLKSRGTIIVFPSILLHSVTRVIKGTRHSLVQWYSGPDFV